LFNVICNTPIWQFLWGNPLVEFLWPPLYFCSFWGKSIDLRIQTALRHRAACLYTSPARPGCTGTAWRSSTSSPPWVCSASQAASCRARPGAYAYNPLMRGPVRDALVVLDGMLCRGAPWIL
jgi:hypothetical protein